MYLRYVICPMHKSCIKIFTLKQFVTMKRSHWCFVHMQQIALIISDLHNSVVATHYNVYKRRTLFV
jgi:hypothetical protein